MGKDENELIERLTHKTLRDLAGHISNEYFDLTQKQDWSDAAVAEALVEKTRDSLILYAGITDSETVMNCDLSPFIEELRKTSMLPNYVLHALKQGVALDYAARGRGPEDVLPDAPEL